MATFSPKNCSAVGNILSVNDSYLHWSGCHEYFAANYHILARVGASLTTDNIYLGVWVVVQHAFYSMAMLAIELIGASVGTTVRSVY